MLLCKTVVELKLVSEGSFGKSDEKHDESVRYVPGLDSMDSMVVGFKEIEKVYNFATHDFKVQMDRKSYSPACKPG